MVSRPDIRRLAFAFAVHDHQPVGNFPEIIARAHDRAYRPFLEAISRHPALHFSLHLSGSLLEWMEANAPGTVNLVGEMVAAGQCEILAGTYYESLAPIAPARDVRCSIRAYAEKLAAVFGSRPRGMWLAERVYETHLPALLAEAGVEYAAVDDWHFRVAGLGGFLDRPAVAEFQGARIKLFPISQRMRYLVPFAPVDEVMAELRRAFDAGAPMVCLADDGEKFGEWPGTFEHCYEEGWLEDFLAALEGQAAWLKTSTLAEVRAEVAAWGPAYLPASSYYEMTRWALPTENQRRLAALGPAFEIDGEYGDLVTGASFRSFFHKHPEINYFHKRVQELSGRLAEAEAARGEEAPAIRRELWRAEANDSYWHGVFGGCYLPHLRRGAKTAFTRAEMALDRWVGETSTDVVGDLDADGGEEIVLKNERLVAVLKGREGLSVVELTRREPPTVLTDVMARRLELYHERLARPSEGETAVRTIHAAMACKEPGLDDYLVYDRRPKRLFLERLFEAGANLAGYARETAVEAPAAAWGRAGPTGDGWGTAGGFGAPGGGEFILVKKLALLPAGLGAAWEGQARLNAPVIFGLEVTLNLTSPQAEYASVSGAPAAGCAEPWEAPAAARWEITDKLAAWTLALTWEPALALWHAPIYTVSCSESGYEKVYQGSSFFFWREITPGDDRLAVAATLELS